MILKNLDYRTSEHDSGAYEEWNYFDNIKSVSCYYNESTQSTVVCCYFNDDSVVTIDVPCVAYLMSDSGKTIDKIFGATKDKLPNPEDNIYPTMQEAVDYAKKESNSP